MTRDYAPFDLIHFTVRGHRRRQIFHCEADHREFLDAVCERLATVREKYRPLLHAYGQMPNHQHVLMSARSDPTIPPAIMRAASTSYAKSYNWRNGTSGPVFQRPFRGRVIRGSNHMINTFAYIHLNPDASLRATNSSHGFYAGLVEDPRIDPALAWRVFGDRAEYMRFFNDTARLREARQQARRRLELG
ncbi:MAG: hypothetical protein QM648_05565 [Solirubrobacterales bacterium]